VQDGWILSGCEKKSVYKRYNVEFQGSAGRKLLSRSGTLNGYFLPAAITTLRLWTRVDDLSQYTVIAALQVHLQL
jgi:hypothetical protein